jgi:alanine racemase
MSSMAAPGGRAGTNSYRVRPAWAEIDLPAVRHNASVLAEMAAPAELCAVVKAGGYGHGAVEVSRAALAGGATGLAVALVEEGRELRAAGITAPILVLSEPPADAMGEVVAAGLTPTLYTPAGLEGLRRAVRAVGATRSAPATLSTTSTPSTPATPSTPSTSATPATLASLAAPGRGPFPAHVKIDTGMHRVGAQPEDAVALAAEVAADPALRLEGFWTHLAVSDEVTDPFTATQFDRYEAALAALEARSGLPAIRHASNSGGVLWHPRGRYDMARCGIALYGLSPAEAGPELPDLRPVMSLKARVSYARPLAAGERLSYGRRYELPVDSIVATVPLGYADGVPRRLAAAGGQVLIGGRRRPLAGTVTMDQILVDCGPAAGGPDDVAAGDEVVLIGRQGDEEIGAWEWAAATDTIAYEVVCGISGRVPRVYLQGSWRRAAG